MSVYEAMTPYVPVTDFSDDELQQTGGRSTIDTSGLDAELALVKTSLDQLQNNLLCIQRTDGFLEDRIVKTFNLDSSVTSLLGGEYNVRGAWGTTTAYVAGDVVTEGAGTYLCAESHTSGVFLTDLAAFKWVSIGALQGGVSPDPSLITDGLFHLVSASAGIVIADGNADELVIEGAGNAGLAILTPDANSGSIHWGSPSGNSHGALFFNNTSLAFSFDISSVNRLFMSASAIVFNDTGTDTDFRVEGDNSTHLFFCDAGNNRAGVSLSGNLVTDGLFHIASGSAGTVIASTSADELIIEGSITNVGLSILGTATGIGNIFFGSPTGSGDGKISYNHTTRVLAFGGTGVNNVLEVSNVGVVVNNLGIATNDFRVESDLNTHMFFIDAGNNSVHIDNNLLTGAGDGDLVMANNNSIRWINNAETTSAGNRVFTDSSDNFNFDTGIGTAYNFLENAVGKFFMLVENSGMGLTFQGESSADHSAPASNDGVIYTKDVSGETELFFRNSTSFSQVTNVAKPWTYTGSIDLTSGSPTAVSLLSGASDVEEIEIWITGFSTNTNDQAPLIQLGDPGGLETSGYSGSGTTVTSGYFTEANSAGFFIGNEGTQDLGTTAEWYIRLIHLDSNVWSFTAIGKNSVTALIVGTGDKTLTAALDRVSLTTSGGSATFDGGTAYTRHR